MFNSILASSTGSVTVIEIIICTVVALFLGLIISLVYRYRNAYSNNFLVTLALLPVMIQAVIMLVNGNLGTGVAVAGAFSLVRFRSAPGNAREIVSIFFAMAVGLATGMGYIAYAVFFTALVGVVMLLYTYFQFGEGGPAAKTLRVVIPEDMEYAGAFDDIFKEYTTEATLDRARTTNLGSLFELQYQIVLKNTQDEKHMIDEIRQRNGNLNIICGSTVRAKDEL